jgi:hypothetical protein
MTKKPAAQTDRPTIQYVLGVVVVIAAAVLVTLLTLPLLSGSFTTFVVAAGLCWVAIFAGAFVLTRRLGRSKETADGENQGPASAPGPEGSEPPWPKEPANAVASQESGYGADA